MIPLNFQKQRFEANFRFSLVRVRENAEGIALYRGEEREAEALNARFADVFANGWQVLFTQAQLASTASYQRKTCTASRCGPTT